MNKFLATGTILAAVSLAGCAPVVWDKPGGTQSEFNVDQAQCQLFAKTGQGGWFAAGSPSFVAGAALGNSIAAGANMRENYKLCMETKGYTGRGKAYSEGDSAFQNSAPDVAVPPGATCDQCIRLGARDCHAQCMPK
jgi:hypothetical protein